MTATDPGPEQLMAAAVEYTVRRLNNGDVVKGALEDLWRSAYAVGVRVKPSRPKLSPALEEVAGKAASATLAGWSWGPASALSGPDSKDFRYGGTDPSQPQCDRPAVVSGEAGGRLRMMLADTGERVNIPVMLWYRPAEGRDGEDG